MKTIKRIGLMLFCSLGVWGLQAQQNFDNQLKEVFTLEELNAMSESTISESLFLIKNTCYFSNTVPSGVSIIPIEKISELKFPSKKTLQFDYKNGNVNGLRYNFYSFAKNDNERVYIATNDPNKPFLVVRSKEELKKMFTKR